MLHFMMIAALLATSQVPQQAQTQQAQTQQEALMFITARHVIVLEEEVADLKIEIAKQNELLETLVHPPQKHHSKIVKTLLIVERIGTDVASVASISSVFGWVLTH